jgi:hypothetical protein
MNLAMVSCIWRELNCRHTPAPSVNALSVNSPMLGRHCSVVEARSAPHCHLGHP